MPFHCRTTERENCTGKNLFAIFQCMDPAKVFLAKMCRWQCTYKRGIHGNSCLLPKCISFSPKRFPLHYWVRLLGETDFKTITFSVAYSLEMCDICCTIKIGTRPLDLVPDYSPHSNLRFNLHLSTAAAFISHFPSPRSPLPLPPSPISGPLCPAVLLSTAPLFFWLTAKAGPPSLLATFLFVSEDFH